MKKLNRRHFLQISGAGAVALSGSTQTHATSSMRPNVVLIISDDHGFTDYGFMGHDTIQTPNIDQLAKQSVTFTRGYVTTALCCPSLATLLTGLYPHQHRVTGNDPIDKDERHLWFEVFEQCPRLPAMLAEAGYLSFQSGKYWMGHYARAGFTHGMTDQGRHGGPGLEIGRSTMQPLYDFMDEAGEKQKPFFVWYAPFLPHLPHNPPESILKKYESAGENAKYYAMCDWFDQTCGELLDYLDQQDLAKNTIVIYIADNGWPRPYKGSPYELGVRTPIMFRWPEKLEPEFDPNLANSIDIVPTIITACGLTPPDEMPGINLLDREQREQRDTIFLENFAHDMADVDHPEKSLRARTIIQGDWKLIVWEEEQPDFRISGQPKPEADRELFNLKDDPLEKENLVEKHPEKVRTMEERLDQWWDPSQPQE